MLLTNVQNIKHLRTNVPPNNKIKGKNIFKVVNAMFSPRCTCNKKKEVNRIECLVPTKSSQVQV